MNKPKKQLRITKMLKKGVTATKPSKDCDELQEEVRQLEQQLKQKQAELFVIQRNALRRKASPPKKKEDSFIRPQRIILNNSIESLKKSLELMAMLSGTEVQSYMAGDHCCVVFHMQHESEHVVQHGLRIDMSSGKNEISSMSLPLGYNLSGVMEDFDNVMKPECLSAIRKALVAYYDRLEQYQLLKKLVNIEGELFKTLDASHVSISLVLRGAGEEESSVTLLLDYRVYDIRPHSYTIRGEDLPEGAADIIRGQCAVFKKKLLHKAFKEAFLSSDSQYTLLEQMEVPSAEKRPHTHKRFRPNKHAYNDDTFLPEDCSDQGDDDDDASDT